MLPTPVTLSVLPEIVPAPVLLASMVKTTALPEAPPVAAKETVRPGEKVSGDAGWVKLMDCAA